MSNTDTEKIKYLNSGFFNSLEGTKDRTYDAEDMTRMFDGLITDGVFSAVGSCFVANAAGGFDINIGTGRAWFNNTWMINDGVKQVTVDTTPLIMSRYDAIVLEVNKTEEIRQNSIKVITGPATDDPQKPEMIHEGGIDQYPICYIYVESGMTEVTQADIENTIGTEETPFVTGLLEHVDIQTLLTQWDAQWQQEQAEHMAGYQETFETWLSHLQDELDEEQAAHLQRQIDDINTFLGNIGNAEDNQY